MSTKNDMKSEGSSTKVYNAVKKKILTFQVLPGGKISDAQVAKSMGKSRTPVREALNRLSKDGLVTARQNRGFSVKSFTKKEMEDLCHLRETLEKFAVKLTINKLNQKKSIALKKTVDRYYEMYKTQNLQGANSADLKFHDLIAKYSGNKALYETIRTLADKIVLARRYYLYSALDLQEAYEEHKKIAEFILARETKKAEKAMSKHIMSAIEDIMRGYKR